jgi:hypothetical protein
MLIDRILLEKQFTKSQIKQRKGNFGTMIDYVPTQLVIQRLNDAFDSLWNFKVIEHQILENEVIILGELYAAGVSKQQFGSNKISKSKQGETISIGDDLKSATSDSLKKCASLLGVALHIYGDSLPDQPEEKKEKALKEFREKPLEFTETTELPPSPPDKPRLQRISEAYFAGLPEALKGEFARHEWQRRNIGITSTKEWTEWHFEKALDMLNILNTEHDPEGKKEVPELDDTQYKNNFGNDTATTAQLNYIQKLLEKKNYYVKGNGNNVWTKAKASVLINWLNEQP